MALAGVAAVWEKKKKVGEDAHPRTPHGCRASWEVTTRGSSRETRGRTRTALLRGVGVEVSH